ncbi:hypothetical protein BSK56_13810 [Paenibacillus borealis]|uniref:FAD-binding domain-containing protein n=1 Tax=Paenibacillus borealis TaxID=160799 RepID=A0ABX3HDP3_PAEBO|nr:hypothetical protein BSK56_13810 [Paenibacillus borealis]
MLPNKPADELCRLGITVTIVPRCWFVLVVPLPAPQIWPDLHIGGDGSNSVKKLQLVLKLVLVH